MFILRSQFSRLSLGRRVTHQISGVRRSKGLTLVELLVGISIGVLVVIAAVGTLSFVKAVVLSLTEAARLQQRSDAIFRNIGSQLMRAGSVEVVAAQEEGLTIKFDNTFTGFRPEVTGASVTGPNKQIYSIHGLNGDGTPSSVTPDTLRVSYQSNGVSLDCLGNATTTSAVNNQFSVVGQNLVCGGATAASSSPIGSGVEDFQVMYGVPSGNQYSYYRADEMLGFGLVPNWENVQAVMICLQLVGESLGGTGAGTALVGCSNTAIASDGRIRRVYRRTFTLRNALS